MIGMYTYVSFLYLKIPSAVVSAIAAILSENTVVQAEASSPTTRFCGRYFQTSEAAFTAQSVCCKFGYDFFYFERAIPINLYHLIP